MGLMKNEEIKKDNYAEEYIELFGATKSIDILRNDFRSNVCVFSIINRFEMARKVISGDFLSYFPIHLRVLDLFFFRFRECFLSFEYSSFHALKVG